MRAMDAVKECPKHGVPMSPSAFPDDFTGDLKIASGATFTTLLELRKQTSRVGGSISLALVDNLPGATLVDLGHAFPKCLTCRWEKTSRL